MMVEAVCIVLIFVIMSFLFLRTGRKAYSLLTLPLAVVPLANIVANLLTSGGLQAAYPGGVKLISLLIGFAVGLTLMGVLSHNIPIKKSRNAYLIVSGGFTTILTFIFASVI